MHQNKAKRDKQDDVKMEKLLAKVTLIITHITSQHHVGLNTFLLLSQLRNELLLNE